MTGSLVYLDSAAIVKLVVQEAESADLFAWLADRSERVTSAMAGVEVRRALRRAGVPAAAMRRAMKVFETMALIPIDRTVLDTAGALDPPELRSLDAIHLATALSVGAELAGFVTYDQRLAAAARRARIEVSAPGVE